MTVDCAELDNANSQASHGDRPARERDNINFLVFLSVLYLYIPLLVFSIAWLQIYLLIPATVCMVYFFFRNRPTGLLRLTKGELIGCLIALAIIVLWCILSGLGGFTYQTGDWKKHNLLLMELIDNDWPVHCTVGGQEGVLVYYIGY
ncbi:MAG: hypothetical protein ACOYIK_06785, partial [Coriobacteriales bacterium]